MEINAEELKAILNIDDNGNKEELVQAKPYHFEFQLYPAGEKPISELEGLVREGRFLNHFYIFDIKERAFSPNNPDVFVVEGRLVLVDMFRKNQLLPLKIDEKEVYVEVRSGKPTELKSETDQIFFANLPPYSRLSFWQKILYALIAFFALSALFAGGRKLYLKIKKSKDRKLLRKRLLDTFQSAQSRDDFERLYRQRQSWIEYLGGKNPETVTFLKDMEEVQYKKEWSEVELENIRKKTQEIQRTLESI